MAWDKKGDMDFPFIHFKDPPEQPATNDTYYNLKDTSNPSKNYRHCEIESKEIKYIKRRHSRKC